MSINFVILLAAVFYGLFNYCMKMASGKISNELGSFLLEGIAAVLILGYMAILKLNGWQPKYTREGIIFSLLSGVFVAVSTILYFVVFRSGGRLSSAGPMILLGGTIVMVLIGVVVLKEQITISTMVGLVLGMTSLYLLQLTK